MTPINKNFTLSFTSNSSIPTYQFKSGEVLSRKLLISLIQNEVAFDLTGLKAKIYILKPDNTKIFDNCVIEDAEKGLISYVLTTQCTTSIGTSKAEVVIYGTNNEKIISQTFQFAIIEAIEDDDAIESTNELTALTVALDNVATFKTEMENAHHDNVTNIDYNDISSRMDAQSASLAEKANQVDLDTANTNITTNTATIAAQATLIQGLASGTPKGIYATLSALTAAFPSGDTNNYVVIADGHIYYWNTANTLWTDTGIQYQSTGLADKLVTYQKTDFLNNNELFVSTNATLNQYLNGSGILNSNTSYFTSEYIPAVAGSTYYFKAYSYALYDSTQTLTYSTLVQNDFNFEVTPTQNGYIRFSGYKASITSYYMKKDTKQQIIYNTLGITKNNLSGALLDSLSSITDITNFDKGFARFSDPTLDTKMSTYDSIVLNVNVGDRLLINGYYTGAGTSPILLVDGVGVRTKLFSGQTKTFTNTMFTIPTGYTQIIFNFHTSQSYRLQQYVFNLNTKVHSLEASINSMNTSMNASNYVIFWGDSLTQGIGSTAGNDYVSKFQALVTDGHIAIAKGIGGEIINAIAARQGGIPAWVQPFTIPATKDTPVAISLKNVYNEDVCSKQTGFVNIGGISGYFGNLGTTNMTFSRSQDGTATTISRPQLLYLKGDLYKNCVMVIWAGSNDALSSATVQIAIKKYKAMIDYNSNKKYIIIGMTAKYAMPDLSLVNNQLAYEFGEHFLDISSYVLKYGLSDANITPTAQDNTDIANGEIPTSLRYDNAHFNDIGYNIIAQQVYAKGKQLNYWT